jgi:V/A-type H+-transporting ATPase subunit C
MDRASLMGASNTAYVTARVRTRTMTLLPREEMARMMDMSVPQILKTLQETVYKREIEESAPLFRFSTADVIEHAVNLNLGRTYRKVYEHSHGPLKGGVSAYILYWDVWNLKTALRGFNSSSPREEVLSDMVFGGSLPEHFWTRLLDDRENIADHFKGTPFHHILRSYHGREGTSEVEDHLDRLYYENLFQQAVHRSKARSDRIFLEFVRKEIDLRNLASAVKVMFLSSSSKDEGQVASLCRRTFIRNGWSLNHARFQELCSSKDVSEIIERSSSMWYDGLLRASMDSEGACGSKCFSGTMELSLIDLASRYSISYPLSILPILTFLLRKRSEVENIRLIARARSHGLSREEIKEISWM